VIVAAARYCSTGGVGKDVVGLMLLGLLYMLEDILQGSLLKIVNRVLIKESIDLKYKSSE